MAPAPRTGIIPSRAGFGRCTAASARAPGPPGRGIHGPRTRGLLRSVQPREGGGNRGHVTARRVPRGRSLPRLRRFQPARARAPAPTCPCGPGECGSRSRAASRVPARRHRLSAHYVMPRHAAVQPTRARAPPNVNTARTWLARPGHVRGGPGRRRRAALRRCREPGGRPRGGPGSDKDRARGRYEARSNPPRWL